MEQWTGYLKLQVANRERRTVVSDVYFQGAFKITRPVYLDDSGQPCFYIMNPGGGYVDGDSYRTDIILEEQAHLLLTTQSSTKVYKTVRRPVIQETEINLKMGSFLEYMPDPIIAYENARYKQNTVIRMERGASLVYADMITPGWAPDGGLFRYNQVQMKTEVYMNDELAVYDQLRLSPGQQQELGFGVLDGYTHFGTMMVIGEQTTSELLDQLHHLLEEKDSSVRTGISMLAAPGFMLRVLAYSTQDIESVFERCDRLIRKTWFQKEPVSFRKY